VKYQFSFADSGGDVSRWECEANSLSLAIEGFQTQKDNTVLEITNERGLQLSRPGERGPWSGFMDVRDAGAGGDFDRLTGTFAVNLAPAEVNVLFNILYAVNDLSEVDAQAVVDATSVYQCSPAYASAIRKLYAVTRLPPR
jgi:hypothetical protein